MQLLLFIIACLSILLIVFGGRCIYNYSEKKRMARHVHTKLSMLRPWERGFIAADFMRGIAEACCLVLLLASVLGWMSYKGH